MLDLELTVKLKQLINNLDYIISVYYNECPYQFLTEIQGQLLTSQYDHYSVVFVVE